jgi:hypothetical protein
MSRISKGKRAFIKALRKAGYKVFIRKERFNSYLFVQVRGKNITGAFCTPPLKEWERWDCYPDIKNLFSADHVDCFDKWSKCPIRGVSLNESHENIIKALEFLGSEEGLKISNEYTYYPDNPFTKIIECGLKS